MYKLKKKNIKIQISKDILVLMVRAQRNNKFILVRNKIKVFIVRPFVIKMVHISAAAADVTEYTRTYTSK